MHESEKTRLERIMSEFTADNPPETAGREAIFERAGRRVGEEELLTERGRRKRSSPDIQEGVLRVRQSIRDEMAFRGISILLLANKTGMARAFLQAYFNGSKDISISSLVRIAHAMGCDMKIWFETTQEDKT